ncbi:MAG TPA: hypothetical protein DIT04_07605 [Dysgonomonas sp.]|nr:hypothetical protein [Dysgonomonas sp.]
MKNFILGLAVGAAAVYVASKLLDDEAREEIFEEVDKAAEKAKETLRYGKGRAMRVGVRARQEVRKSKQKLSEAAGDFAGKLSDDLAEYEEKAKTQADNA